MPAVNSRAMIVHVHNDRPGWAGYRTACGWLYSLRHCSRRCSSERMRSLRKPPHP